MKKSFFAGFMAVVFLVNSVGFAGAASFSDTSDLDTEVEFLAESSVVEGRSMGVYEPDELVNRAEMMKIILVSLGVSPGDEYSDCFPDVSDQWFAPFVCYGYENGIITGYDDGMFRPGDFVNLVEALKMTTYAYELEFEGDGGEWYSDFYDGSKAYEVTEEGDPGKYVTRREMAQIVARIAIVNMTDEAYSPRTLFWLRSYGKKIQDISKKGADENLGDYYKELSKAKWTVKISASSGDRFEIRYPHHKNAFVATEGASEVYLPPTIQITEESGFAQMGLNTDLYWDASADPDEGIAMADADLSGFSGKSINMYFDPDAKSVTINSELGEKTMTVNLSTGAISGDDSLTQGYSSLNSYFGDGGGEVFTVCVNDGQEYWGEIGIFSDMKTVGIRECVHKPTVKPAPIVIEAYPPLPAGFLIEGKKKLPPNPPGPGGAKNPGGGGQTTEWIEEPDDGVKDSDPYTPETATDEGESVGDSADRGPAPVPANHPGFGYEKPKGSSESWEDFYKRVKEANERNAKVALDNKESIAEGIKNIEAMLEVLGLGKPDAPKYDASACCPTYSKDGKCCSDLDLSTEEGKAEYRKRMNCLVGDFNDALAAVNKNLNMVNMLAGRIASLEVAEANMALLALAVNLHKGMFHILIDVGTGGGGWITGFLKAAVEEVFSGSDLVKVIAYIENHEKALTGDLVNKLTDWKEIRTDLSSKLADKMGLSGKEKEKFIENMSDKFENVVDLFNPSVWAKAVVDAMLDVGGAGAENFLESVEKMRETRNENLQEAYKNAMLLSQINDVLNKVRTEDCTKKYEAAIKKKAEELKKKEETYKKRINEDNDVILDMIDWILDGEIFSLTADDPSEEELKARIAERLKEELCKHGFDLCWVDVHYKIVIIKKGNSIRWEITEFEVKKRETPKDSEDCKCEEAKAVEDDDSDVSDDSDTESGQDDEEPVGDVTDPGEESHCADCISSEDLIDDDASLGSSSAPVTIVEFSDYECPFCSIYSRDTFPLIKENYIDTGLVRYVFRDFPLNFHQNAFEAAIAAECVGEQLGDSGYFEFHDILFAEQGAWAGIVEYLDVFESYAAAVGADPVEFVTCMVEEQTRSEVEADIADGGVAGVVGTPNFFIGDEMVMGAHPYDVFEAAIERALLEN